MQLPRLRVGESREMHDGIHDGGLVPVYASHYPPVIRSTCLGTYHTVDMLPSEIHQRLLMPSCLLYPLQQQAAGRPTAAYVVYVYKKQPLGSSQ